jgi:hypothetical protein
LWESTAGEILKFKEDYDGEGRREKGEGERKMRNSERWGEYDQSTSYACMEMSR